MPALEDPNVHQFLVDTPRWFREPFERFEAARREAGEGAPTEPVEFGDLTYFPGVAQPAQHWFAFTVIMIAVGMGFAVFGILMRTTGDPSDGLFAVGAGFVAVGILLYRLGRRASRPDPEHLVRLGIVLVPEGLVVVRRDRFGVYPRQSIHAFTRHWRQVSGSNDQPRTVVEEAMYLAEGRYVRLSESEDVRLRERLKKWLSDDG